VGEPSLTYIGNHGLELLGAGSSRVETLSEAASHTDSARSFAAAFFTPELRRAGIRLEDKESIWAFHWRQAPDEDQAVQDLELIAEEATAKGLRPHWGRKVLEIRPPVEVNKGLAVERAVRQAGLGTALYAGDDTTDLDAFRKLRELRSSGTLKHAVCVGVRSTEGPSEIVAEADLTVNGPADMAELLALL
jgi:trehalose 6-phosphate phosphatase